MFLFGESGIGKSVICKAIYGLLDPDELSVSINNSDYIDYCGEPWTTEIRNNSFFVFQEPSSHLNPLMTIAEQLREGSLAGKGEQDSDERDRKSVV
jgi:ABC-type glutathione transport system ATPase component